jgi:hypothetical protein
MFLVATVFFPLVLLTLMLAMERVERPLRAADDPNQELEDFLDSARPDEVDTFVSQGFAAALERYRKRKKRANSGKHRAA